MKLIHHRSGLHVKIKSWIDLSEEDFFIIKSDRLITITKTKDEK